MVMPSATRAYCTSNDTPKGRVDCVWEIKQGDALSVLKTMPDQSINTCVTSPPYWGLRDYGVDGQLGLEPTPAEYVANLVEVFREVKRVLRDDGTLWLNLGDSYASGGMSNPSSKSTLGGGKDLGAADYSITRKVPNGLKSKDLVGIPWRVALALQADGWYLRSDIIWHKPNAMPESVTDRPTKAHEYIFLLSKSQKYYYDADSIKEPSSDLEKSKKRYEKPFGEKKAEELLKTNQVHTRTIGMREIDGKRNKRTVWTVPTQPFPEAHFAVYPPALITPCILAGCPVGGTVLDPFAGSGTTLLVAIQHHRKAIGIELNPEYVEIAKRRLNSVQLKLVME